MRSAFVGFHSGKRLNYERVAQKTHDDGSKGSVGKSHVVALVEF